MHFRHCIHLIQTHFHHFLHSIHHFCFFPPLLSLILSIFNHFSFSYISNAVNFNKEFFWIFYSEKFFVQPSEKSESYSMLQYYILSFHNPGGVFEVDFQLVTQKQTKIFWRKTMSHFHDKNIIYLVVQIRVEFFISISHHFF